MKRPMGEVHDDNGAKEMEYFWRFLVKHLRHSKPISDEKFYLYRRTRHE